MTQMVYISNQQANNLQQLQKIIAEVVNLRGCPGCKSGRDLAFQVFEEQMAPTGTPAALVALPNGKVQRLEEIAQQASGVK
jgi:hypothetical protein